MNNTILIDQYLNGEMSAEERQAFEQRLQSDSSLQQELKVQQQLIDAVQQAGIKQEFAKAIRTRKWLQKMVWATAIIAVAAAAIFAYKMWDNHSANNEKNNTPSKDAEQFTISTTKDTVIETKDGLILAIPAHAFQTNNATVRLQIETALKPYDILRKGLTTTSNGALLQTAGMFSINGYDESGILKMDKKIQVSVPANQKQNGMMLFDGVEDKNGAINWVNPKPIDNNLRTYDITTLDFYPPDYIPTLKALKKPYQDKHYTDSLYYSFAGYRVAEAPVAVIEEKNGNDYNGGADTSKYPEIKSDSSANKYTFTYQIDPAIIHSIWDKKFNNTILATKEFEERLKYIHSFCGPGDWINMNSDFLKVFLKNLDKPLYYSDSVCYFSIWPGGDRYNRFKDFFKRRDGGVLITDGLQEQLSSYIQNKYAEYKQLAEATRLREQNKLDSIYSVVQQKRIRQQYDDAQRIIQNFNQELEINLNDAYRQIGKARPAPTYYNVTITSPGWKNLDQYVFDATVNRESMTYTDPTSGKQARITYNDVSITIQNRNAYDQVLVYFIPDSLNSFQRGEEDNNQFHFKLNTLFHYDAVVLAYKGTQCYWIAQTNIQSQHYSWSLEPVSTETLNNSLAKYAAGKQEKLRADFNYQFFEQEEKIREVQLQKDIEFREAVLKAIFPCYRGFSGNK